jgi:hypothetical protein
MEFVYNNPDKNKSEIIKILFKNQKSNGSIRNGQLVKKSKTISIGLSYFFTVSLRFTDTSLGSALMETIKITDNSESEEEEKEEEETQNETPTQFWNKFEKFVIQVNENAKNKKRTSL